MFLFVLLPLLNTFADDWEYREVVDDLTQRRVNIASVTIKNEEQSYSLFVRCRDEKTFNIGIVGTGGSLEGKNEYDYVEIPMRFDPLDSEAKPEYFLQHDDVLFLKIPSPDLAKLLFQITDSVEKAQSEVQLISRRGQQIFLKKLASSSRLLVKVSLVQGETELIFPLIGAKEALESLVSSCNTELAGGTDVFNDADSTEYKSFLEMIEDETWVDRYQVRTALLDQLPLRELSIQGWQYRESQDDFTDERVSIASVRTTKGRHSFTLFVNCRTQSALNVGITGSYINPTTSSFPVRFDTNQPDTMKFNEQGDYLFLAASFKDEQIFIKKLTSATRLRVKFPQYPNDINLEFDLTGANTALVSMAKSCKTKISNTKSASFLDANGKKYISFVDMLEDEDWVSRYTPWNVQEE